MYLLLIYKYFKVLVVISTTNVMFSVLDARMKQFD